MFQNLTSSYKIWERWSVIVHCHGFLLAFSNSLCVIFHEVFLAYCHILVDRFGSVKETRSQIPGQA